MNDDDDNDIFSQATMTQLETRRKLGAETVVWKGAQV